MESAFDLELEQLDVKTASLHGNIEEQIYIYIYIYINKRVFLILEKKIMCVC